MLLAYAETTSGIDYKLNNSQQMIQAMAHDFAANEILPVADAYDRSHQFPWPVIEKAHELGLTTMSSPEAYGGSQLTVLEETLVAEELAWGCGGIAMAILVHNGAALPLVLGGNESQKRHWLGRLADGEITALCMTEPAAGSDVAGIQTTARREGQQYILNGTKTFISGATVAGWFTVLANTDPHNPRHGLSAFIVDSDTPGVSVGRPLEKMGQNASDTAEVVFDNVRIPVGNRIGLEGDGFMLMMKFLEKSRPVFAAMAVGMARRAMEESIKYASERKSMGKPIYKHQAVGHMIADMAIQIEAARLLVRKAAMIADEGQSNIAEAAMAKAFAADMAMKVCTDAIQVFGGYGYMREYPVEKLLRDVKVCQIYEGTSQIQRNIIVRELFR